MIIRTMRMTKHANSSYSNVIKLLLSLLALALLATTTAATANDNGNNADTSTGTDPPDKKKYTLAVVEFFQETNSFSPVLTTLQEFQGNVLWYGKDDILEFCTTDETKGHIGGFLQAVQDIGNNKNNNNNNNDNDNDIPLFDVIPILQARSVSGGPIQRDLFDHFQDTIVNGLMDILEQQQQQQLSLDGIYLSLHGAMGVEGLLDPEGHLLEAIRNVVGNGIPIGVTHDLHANLTKKRMDLITYLIGYRTNPHRDFYEVGYAAGKIMVQTCLGEIHPTMAYQKMRLLKGGGFTIDLLHPMRQIFNWMYNQEKADPTILWLSTFMVHIWLDDPELGWTTVAVTDNDMELATTKATELADMNWDVRAEPHPTGYSPKEAVEIAESYWISRMFGTVVFCDVSDAVGAGAPGESTWILKALMQQDEQREQQLYQQQQQNSAEMATTTVIRPLLTSYITLRDAEVVNYIFLESGAKMGDTLTLEVGGKLDKITNSPVTFTGELIYKSSSSSDDDDDSDNNNNTNSNKIAIVRHNGIHLILNEIADPLHTPEYLTNLGLSLWNVDIVVVKNLFPFRYRYLLYNRKTVNVITPGVTNIDVKTLNYKNVPRPIYPLEEDMESWRSINDTTGAPVIITTTSSTSSDDGGFSETTKSTEEEEDRDKQTDTKATNNMASIDVQDEEL